MRSKFGVRAAPGGSSDRGWIPHQRRVLRRGRGRPAGHRRRRSRWPTSTCAATSSPACAARPSWPSTARCCAPCTTLRTELLEPSPGLLPDILVALEAAGERGAMRFLLTGRRAAYLGGIAAATAAGAAGAIVLASRRHRRVAVAS